MDSFDLNDTPTPSGYCCDKQGTLGRGRACGTVLYPGSGSGAHTLQPPPTSHCLELHLWVSMQPDSLLHSAVPLEASGTQRAFEATDLMDVAVCVFLAVLLTCHLAPFL
ncbi:Hypothetical predicted protein [Marmota monax]|uniref:Uncharacterized protein n=1 Tax=Marmota monax TaxID=9995 RepID=A0A5E4B8G1_MARMO|nr:hypothetical protein GHT09_006894 [Marmota monax]VTJ65566.1 Hypothetical predicted protein [Marmota monax]